MDSIDVFGGCSVGTDVGVVHVSSSLNVVVIVVCFRLVHDRDSFYTISSTINIEIIIMFVLV